MYISSDGTRKCPKNMNTEYIINALNKIYREVFTIKSVAMFERYMNNKNLLENELTNRIADYALENIKEE